MRPTGARPIGRIPELHVNHDDTALVLRRRKRLPSILVLRVFEGKFRCPIAAAVLLAASNLFDDPGIQHRITSPLVLTRGYKTATLNVKTTSAQPPRDYRPIYDESALKLMQAPRLGSCDLTQIV